MTPKTKTTSAEPCPIERRLNTLPYNSRALLAGWLSKLTASTNPVLAERLKQVADDAKRQDGNSPARAAG